MVAGMKNGLINSIGRIWIVVIVLLLGLSAGPSIAATPLVLDTGMSRLSVPEHMDILEDPGGGLTFEEVISNTYVDKFQPHIGDDEFNIGHSRSTFWLRFKAIHPDGEPVCAEWFIEFGKPGISEIDFYTPQAGGGWIIKKTGADRPTDRKEVLHRSFVLTLPNQFDSERYFYIRIKSSISINLPIFLWRPAEYTWWTIPDYFGFGVVYGIMVSMIIYNLAIFAFLSDRTYLLYVLYIVMMMVYLLTVYGHLPPTVDVLLGGRLTLLWPILGLTWIAAALFCRSFLNTRVIIPRLDKAVTLIMIMGGGVMVLGLLGWDHWANMLNCLLTPLGSLIAIFLGAVVALKGFKPAMYFLMAWIILLIGMVLYILGGVYIERTFITRYTVAIGAPLESLILSLALAARIKALREEKDAMLHRATRYRELSQTDGLTGIYNKRFIEKRLPLELEKSVEALRSLSLIMMDVDNFKTYNDTYGHPAGDEVLLRLAGVINNSAREGDLPCRYGGEEFVLILPGASKDNALEVAERIRLAFLDQIFEPRPGQTVRVTVSLGLAEWQIGESPHDLVRRADEALYEAKQTGKNRTVAAT